MTRMQLAGVELYASDLHRSKRFYEELLGMAVSEEEPGHQVMFAVLLLQRKGDPADRSEQLA